MPSEANKREERSAATWGCAGGALLIAFAAIVWLLEFSHYWVGREARFYFSGANKATTDFVQFFISPQGLNSRPLSMIAARELEVAFGPSVTVVNIAQIAMLALAFFLVFFHSLQVAKSSMAPFLALVLTLLSGANLNMLLWQATQHDKLMLVFSAAALIINDKFIERARHDVASVVLYGTGLILLVAAANNSKETAIFIAPCLLFQPLTGGEAGERPTLASFLPSFRLL